MKLEDTNVGTRCIDYIACLAERDGVVYSLDRTDRNEKVLDELLVVCGYAEKYGAEQYQANLRSLCAEALSLSINLVTIQQGVKHTEPEDLEPYLILFGYAGATVNMRDVKYKPLEPQLVVLQFNLTSDDEAVMRLTPGTQLSLLDLEGV